MKSLFKSLRQQVQRVIGKKPSATEQEEILEPFQPRDLETVLFFEDRMRPNREAEPQLESRAETGEEVRPEPSASPAAEAQHASPELSGAAHSDHAAAAHPNHTAAAPPEPLAEREPPFWEVEALEVEPASVEAAQAEDSREMTPEEAVVAEYAPVEFHFSQAEPERTEEELEHEPVFLSAVDIPAEILPSQPEPSQPEAAVASGQTRASEQVQEPAPEPAAIESQSEPTEEIPPAAAEATVPKSAPAARPVVPAAPRREPAAPRMEWVTLRFRGTTERVLRIVPSDEDQELTEQEGVFDEEPQSIGYDAVPEPEALAEPMAFEADEPTPAAGHEAEYAAAPANEPPQAESVSVESTEELTEEFAEESEEKSAPQPTEIVLEASPAPSEARPEPEMLSQEFAEPKVMAEAAIEEESAASEPLEAEELIPEPLAELEREFEATEPSLPAYLHQPDRTPEDELVSEAEPVAATEAMIQAEPESTAPEPEFEPAAPAFEAPVAHAAPEPLADEIEPIAEAALEESMPESPQPRARVPVSAWSQGTLEIEAAEARVQPEPTAEPPAGEADRFSPLRLVSELRSRSSSAAPREDAAPAPTWSRRSAAAPVEERLEPRARNLTRRWEMLSRFDSSANGNGSHPQPEAETAEVAAATEPGGR
jgi:hypothetical protein